MGFGVQHIPRGFLGHGVQSQKKPRAVNKKHKTTISQRNPWCDRARARICQRKGDDQASKVAIILWFFFMSYISFLLDSHSKSVTLANSRRACLKLAWMESKRKPPGEVPNFAKHPEAPRTAFVVSCSTTCSHGVKNPTILAEPEPRAKMWFLLVKRLFGGFSSQFLFEPKEWCPQKQHTRMKPSTP